MEQSAFNFKPKVGSLIVTGLIALICIIPIYNQIKYGEKISFVAAAFLFSAGFLFIIFLKTAFKKPALIISDKGIINNSLIGAGSYQITWDKIKSFQAKETETKNTIIIILENPEEIIKEQTLGIKYDMKNKMKKFGTPVIIMCDSLKDSGEIMEIMQEKFKNYYP